MREAGKPITAHYFENAGHGETHWKDGLKRARLIEDFLSQHLRGRFDDTERPPI